jgi:hypothetical protein
MRVGDRDKCEQRERKDEIGKEENKKSAERRRNMGSQVDHTCWSVGARANSESTSRNDRRNECYSTTLLRRKVFFHMEETRK